ncbi:MAG: hypothetical protein IPJ06_19545 [Saprospiraceae bacterium]|nr:hypothetical protein [Saprospiraceae bacterium]
MDYSFLPVVLTFETGGNYPTHNLSHSHHSRRWSGRRDETVDLHLDLLSGSADIILSDHTATILDDDVSSARFRTITNGV